ncbi:MAG TPA: T9SS type A sorting domain-containing protein, partial [Saprospiraceae bacterium]|nr:T9SS type A sorting domain-containing protein [Saprospiraceae bacterium]
FGGVDNIQQPGSESGNWVTPFEKDPITPNTIYVGYEAVFRTDNDGASWDQISQEFPSKLDHLKISLSNPTVMYAAHGNSLYKTATGEGTWEQLSGFAGNINDIAIHPSNPDKIAIATTNTQKVYISNDGGNTWTSYRKNLPNFAANALVWQEGEHEGLYIGMNYGVFYIDNTLSSWEPFVTNLPNVIINELEINYAESKLYAATYGRGLWSTPLFDATPSSTQDNAIAKVTLYPNPAVDVISIESDVEMVDTDIEVYNNVGQIVIKKSNQSFRNKVINVNTLSPGIYYLRMTNKQGQLTEMFSVLR